MRPILSKEASSKRRSFNKLLGEISQERGDRNERFVLEAMEFADRKLEGILAWRRANKVEDRKGIDIVVYTMWGKVLLQVKSSKSGVREFKEKYRNSGIYFILADHVSLIENRVATVMAMALGEIRAKQSC